MSPASPHVIPVVGKNIEVNSADELLMEQHLQRSEHASNMKRMISEEEEEGLKKEGRGVPKMARTGTSKKIRYFQVMQANNCFVKSTSCSCNNSSRSGYFHWLYDKQVFL